MANAMVAYCDENGNMDEKHTLYQI